MLLSKYKNSSSSPHSGATRFLAKFKREKQFAFSPISLVLNETETRPDGCAPLTMQWSTTG